MTGYAATRAGDDGDSAGLDAHMMAQLGVE